MLYWVTGSTGQLGSAIVEELKSKNLSVMASSDVDVTNDRDIEKFMSLNRPDVVINCAAFTDVDGAELDVRNWQVNAYAPYLLSRFCISHQAKLIHISTDYIYDDLKRKIPVNEYGRAKLLGECAVLEWLGSMIIRVSTLCSVDKGLVRSFVNLKKSGRQITIDPKVSVSPTSVYLLAKEICALPLSDYSVRGIFEYNAGSVSLEELVSYLGVSNYSLGRPERLAKRINKPCIVMDRRFTASTWQEHVDDIVKRLK